MAPDIRPGGSLHKPGTLDPLKPEKVPACRRQPVYGDWWADWN